MSNADTNRIKNVTLGTHYEDFDKLRSEESFDKLDQFKSNDQIKSNDNLKSFKSNDYRVDEHNMEE